LSSAGFVILILGPLFISADLAFVVYALLGGFTLNEVFKLSAITGTTANKIVGATAYVLLALFSYAIFFMPGANVKLLVLALSCLLLSGLVMELFGAAPRPLDRLGISVFAPVYISASFLALPYFFQYRNDLNQVLITISVFALIWINDSGAYILGRAFGKTRLYPRISPNKTWEGSIGGLTCSLLAGAGLSWMDGMPSLPFMLGFSSVCVVFGSLGDLFESRIKRAAGVKDSGRFLPGHGGFFDRFDAMMMAVPASIIYFEAVLPK